MAVKGFFFNAIEQEGVYDRLYNNEDFCGYLSCLVGNGVFPNPETHLQIIPTSPASMAVKVSPGHGWINGHKIVVSDTPEPTILEIDPAPAYEGYSRLDRVVFALNKTYREMQVYVKTGVPATEPVAKALQQDNDIYELSLAIIKVSYGTTSITSDAGVIKDTRDTPECGRVMGLIQQVDVSEIASEYEKQYEKILQEMITWQQAAKTEYDSWFAHLTDDLTIGAYLKQYRKIVQGPFADVIPLDMEDYTYDSKDLLHVTLNGLLLSPGSDYRINSTTNPINLILNTEITADNTLDILAIKSSLEPSSGGLITSVVGERYVYIANALPGEAVKRMWINTLGTTNNFVVTGRNLTRVDQFVSYTEGDMQFIGQDGTNKVLITGNSGASGVGCPLPIDSSCFVPGEKYTASMVVNNIDPEDNVSVEVIINGSTIYQALPNDPVTFTIPDVFTSIGLNLTVNGINRDVNGLVGVQVEYGSVAHEYASVHNNTYVYDGINTPMLYDEINNIWIVDPDASELKVAYIVMDSTTDGDSLLYPLENS